MKAGLVFFSMLAMNMTQSKILASDLPFLTSPVDVEKFLPSSTSEIQARMEKASSDFTATFSQILQIPLEKRTFENTIEAWDVACGTLQVYIRLFESLPLVLSDKEMREKSQECMMKLKSLHLDALFNACGLYEGALAIKEKEKNLSREKEYYLQEQLITFQQSGLTLPPEKRGRVKDLRQEISSLCQKFVQNINEDKSFIYVAKEDLRGLPDDFIASLEKNAKGDCKLTCDYPVYLPVMSYSKSAEVRKNLSRIYNNRAYPQNIAILDELIAKRDELAAILAYTSFTEYQISDQMAKSPKTAENFIDELFKNVQTKADLEFKEVTKDLPESVTLAPDGKVYAYDSAFLFNEYKKKSFAIDELQIAQYFPLENTIKGLLSIYEQFFSLSIREVPVTHLWNKDVKLLEIKESNSKEVMGYLLLDLFPRENKFSHACDCPIIPAFTSSSGKKYPALSLVITNFTKPTESKPSLLRYNEVRTFFHEFGHAIHDILGRSNMMMVCGTNVKMDFVEMPSQILEEWLWDKSILKMISSHYLTTKPLPDALIDQMIKARNYDSGTSVQRQCFLSKLPFAYFASEVKKDTTQISNQLRNEMFTQYIFDTDGHFQASFGHLTEYGSLYYGYLWSKVFALDVFEKIKKEGLLDPKVGAEYVKHIIGKGGSEDPNICLKNFLGREPNQKAFINSLGISN